MNKYIVQKLATENNITTKHTEELINGFYRGLRYYLENADESKGGIVIPNYFTFFIDLHREMRSIETSLTNGKDPKRIEVFQNLIKYKHKSTKLSKRDNERQKKITDYIEQCNQSEQNNV